MKARQLARVLSGTFLSCTVLWTSCASRGGAAEESRANPSPVVVTWGIVRYNSHIRNIDPSSEVISYLEKRFGIQLEFTYYDSFNTKILTHMIDNDNCPDLLTMEAMSSEGRFLAANGLVRPASDILSPSEGLIPGGAWDILAETDNTLYGIPGRFASSDEEAGNAASEGVFVSRTYYEQIGSPALRTTDDLMAAAEAFVSRYPSLRRAETDDGESSAEPVPIVLGDSGSGTETLKHLFRIYPVFESGGTARLGIASPRWPDLATWLDRLSRLTVQSMSLSGGALDKVMTGRALFYIGPVDYINYVNFSQPDFPYDQVKLDQAGTLYAVNPYGSCQTYAFKSSDTHDPVRKLLRYLLTEEGNRLVKYGIANRHWISTGKSILPLDWVQKRLRQNGTEFMNQTGIGQLLFLTSLADDNPCTPDVLCSSKDAFFTTILRFDESSNEALKLSKLAQYETDLCQRAASIDQKKHEQKLSLLLSDISHFTLYAGLYPIETLNDRYQYWKSQNLKTYE